MRLAVFTHFFPSRAGSTFFARDMRALLEAGWEIDIFSFYPARLGLWRDVPEMLGEHVLSRDRVHHVSLTSSLASLRPWPAHKFGRFLRDVIGITGSALRYGPIPVIKSAYVYPKAWTWARTHVCEFDHVLAYWGNYAGTCAYLFHRLLDRSVVPFSIFLHAIDLYEDQVFLRHKLVYADNIIVVCDYNQRFIEERFSSIYEMIRPKICKYHLGLDLANFPFQPNGRPQGKILAVGSFEVVKGFEYLLRATSELVHQGMDIQVELIGEGALELVLKRLAQKLGIGDKTLFRGWLPFDEVRTAMGETTILVLPSLGDAVPTVIKEAMALGTPVISTRVGGIPELLDNGRCGILVSPKDVSALATAIKLLLQDERARKHYAREARRRAEQMFDLWRNGKQLANLLKSTTRTKQGKFPKLYRDPLAEQ